MAILTDQNLVNYKKALDDLKIQISAWKKYLSEAETTLNSSVGKTFRDKYKSTGGKAAQNIQIIIDTLQSVNSDLSKLITDANTFYTTSYNAAKK